MAFEERVQTFSETEQDDFAGLPDQRVFFSLLVVLFGSVQHSCRPDLMQITMGPMRKGIVSTMWRRLINCCGGHLSPA